jgi:hypothetical protein
MISHLAWAWHTAGVGVSGTGIRVGVESEYPLQGRGKRNPKFAQPAELAQGSARCGHARN